MNESRLKAEPFYVEEVRGEELADHYRYMFSLPDFKETATKQVEEDFALPKSQINHVFNFKHGNLIFLSAQAIPDAWDIFKRFTAVFEQTYTRFLDLQKAEAQAREAQIEAALEKVRSRSLAMHKSDELQEVVHTLFERLNELNFELDTAIIIIFKEGSKDTVWWLQNSANQQYLKIAVPNANLFYLRNLFEAKENKEDLPSGFYSLEQKNELLNYLFDHTDFRFTPPEQKESLLQKECATMSAAIAKNTAIHITRYFKKDFSEKERRDTQEVFECFRPGLYPFPRFAKSRSQRERIPD
jgi:hypothetical protein